MNASDKGLSDTKNLSEQAHERIRRDILNGELFPGDKLQIEAISERYGIGIAPVREALMRGVSFAARMVDNEYSLLRIPSRLRRLSMIRRLLKSGPRWLRHPYHTTLRPSTVFHDTGSLMDHHLKHQQGLYFLGLPEPVHGQHVHHYFGATRNVFDPSDQNGCGGTNAIAEHVRGRLRSEYSLQM